MKLTGKDMENHSKSKKLWLFVSHSFHSVSKRVVCFYYCLLLFSVSSFVTAMLTVFVSDKVEAKVTGLTSDKVQPSGRLVNVTRDDVPFLLVQACRRLDMIYLVLGGTEICLDHCHCLSEENACR